MNTKTAHRLQVLLDAMHASIEHVHLALERDVDWSAGPKTVVMSVFFLSNKHPQKCDWRLKR